MDRAPLGHDVAGDAALDRAHVGARAVVDPPQPHVGDRAGRSDDRRAALLRVHPRVRRPAVEPRHDALLRRRAEDDLADRRRLVVDEAELGLEPRVVEREGTAEADLLLRGEEQLHARMWDPLLDDPPRRREHHSDGGLVVGAEDRARGVAHDPVLDHGLDLTRRRDRVEVRTEEERRPLLSATGQAAEDVSRLRSRSPRPPRPRRPSARRRRARRARGRRRRAPLPAGSGSRPARGRGRGRRSARRLDGNGQT